MRAQYSGDVTNARNCVEANFKFMALTTAHCSQAIFSPLLRTELDTIRCSAFDISFVPYYHGHWQFGHRLKGAQMVAAIFFKWGSCAFQFNL